MPAKADSKDDPYLQLRFDYAWKWFEYHAGQRTTMLNFFLIVTGILGAAYGTLATAEKDFVGLEVTLMVAGLFTSIGFICLDFRNQRRVNLGEDVLRNLEAAMQFESPPNGDARGKNPTEDGNENEKELREDENEMTPKEGENILPATKPGILNRESDEEELWKKAEWYKKDRWLWLFCNLTKHRIWIPLLEGVVGILFLLGLLELVGN